MFVLTVRALRSLSRSENGRYSEPIYGKALCGVRLDHTAQIAWTAGYLWSVGRVMAPSASLFVIPFVVYNLGEIFSDF